MRLLLILLLALPLIACDPTDPTPADAGADSGYEIHRPDANDADDFICAVHDC